ncbi:trypsin-like peptidase domain-containing protein [Streptacidiphilus monticola]
MLTAAHVVPEGTTGPGLSWSVRLRPAAEDTGSAWFRAEVCWRDRQRDMVLLHVVDRAWTPPAEPDRGHAPPGADVRDCEVLGLPYEFTMPGGERDVFQGDGRLLPAYRQRSAHDRLRVRLTSGLTTPDGWHGMSGGPVLDRQGQLLALVVSVPDQADQLLVADTRSLPSDPHFSTAFAACHQPDLTPPEPPPDLRPALQEEFERVLAGSPLLAESGMVRLLAHDVSRQLRKAPALDYGPGTADTRAMALVADFGDEPPGIRAIVRAHARMSPQEERLNRRLLRRADEWDSLASPLVSRIEDWLGMRARLQAFPLDASALPNIDWPTTKTFWRTVNQDGSEHPPGHCATAWHAFTHLLCRNAATEGLPYAMRFVEELAHASAPETCGELQAANRQWAVQLGLGRRSTCTGTRCSGCPGRARRTSPRQWCWSCCRTACAAVTCSWWATCSRTPTAGVPSRPRAAPCARTNWPVR